MNMQEKNTVVDVLPLVMFMLAITVFPWKLNNPPPQCKEINEEVVVLGQHGFFKDGRIFVAAYKNGMLWGRVILWPDSPLEPLTGTVSVKPYIYKNRRDEIVVFPAVLTQANKSYLTCDDYDKYLSDWWGGVYLSIAVVVLIIVIGFVSGFIWLRKVRAHVI